MKTIQLFCCLIINLQKWELRNYYYYAYNYYPSA